MCEKDINKQQHCLRAFPGVPLFDDADKLAATGFADNVATGEVQAMPEGIDGVFIGYPCVSISGLSGNPGSITDVGCKSGKGFQNMLRIVKRLDPDWIVVEQSDRMFAHRKLDNGNRPIDIQDSRFRNLGFLPCSNICKAERYGVPASRSRSWSIYIRNHQLNVGSDAEAISSTLHSFECMPVKLCDCLVPNPTIHVPRHRLPNQADKWIGDYKTWKRRVGEDNVHAVTQLVKQKFKDDSAVTEREFAVLVKSVMVLQDMGHNATKDCAVVQLEAWLSWALYLTVWHCPIATLAFRSDDSISF